MLTTITTSVLKLPRIILLFFLIITGCATSKGPDLKQYAKLPPSQRPYLINKIWYYPIPTAEGYIEEGIASWYGKPFHGRPTSSGEIYDMHKISAAHKTLPLGTRLKVTNLQNNKSIAVKVNDRGPFVAGRIIDLSFKAAEILDVVSTGTVPVRIKAIQAIPEDEITKTGLPDPEPLPDFRHENFVIQVGAFKTLLNALQLKADLMARYDLVEIKPFDVDDNKFYRVQIGFFKDLNKAQQEVEILTRSGHKGASIVVAEEEPMQPKN